MARPVLPFTKVEGIGNDFVVVDLRPGRPGAAVAALAQDPQTVRAICDRHFGVGADGVLAVLPGEQGDARMRVLNADGTEAEMCGNGIRGVAKVLYDTDPSLRRPQLRIDTGAGPLACELDVADGEVRTVAVQMGRPRLQRSEIPLEPGGDARAVRAEIAAARGRSFRFTAVSMGNPHAVIFVDDEQVDLRALAEEQGPTLEHAATFPRRTNVEMARLRGGGERGGGARGAQGAAAAAAAGAAAEIDLVVWERGCGITLACGTGACATVVAACIEERLSPGAEIPVHLPGGTLFVTVAPDYSGVRMRGPVSTVFRGELDLGRMPGPA